MERARERCLDSGEIGPAVRLPIRLSWRRSLAGAVPRDPSFSFETDVDLDTRLCRAARPVFDRLAARLSATGTSLFLANDRSVLLRRWADTPDLGRRLDRAFSVPGALLDEHRVGTNGVGTVAATGVPLAVTGPEHWAEGYQDLACAGAPIRNRVTGRIEGVLTVTCSQSDNHATVLALVGEAAGDIETELTITASHAERSLLEMFLTATRRSNRAILAASGKVVITTPAAARVLEQIDQSLLWEQIASAEGSGRDGTMVIPWDGGAVDVQVRPHGEATDDGYGVVVEFRPRPPETAAATSGRTSPSLAGWVGRSDAWRAAVRAVVPAVAGRRGVVVQGEPGTGKLSLLRCAALAGGAPLIVFDAALEVIEGTSAWVNDVRAALVDPARPVILRHFELLSESAARALASIIETATTTPPVILGVTVCGALESLPPPVRSLVRQVAPVTIDLPPLRHRKEDVHELVAHLTAGRRRWTPAPLQILLRQDWPDNVRELRQLVELVCATGRHRDVVLDDLPPDLRARSTRRPMSRIEEVGLSALLGALQESGGNKARAAEILGVSRSTVYRKLASSGFDVDHRPS